jgi:hypothetical protein
MPGHFIDSWLPDCLRSAIPIVQEQPHSLMNMFSEAGAGNVQRFLNRLLANSQILLRGLLVQRLGSIPGALQAAEDL